MVEAVEHLPIVGNGDIRTIADAAQMFTETGCAAIAIGRGALGNPFLFRQLAHWASCGDPGPEPTFEERLALMERHFRRLVASRGEFYACLQFRKTLKWYNHLIRPPKPLYHKLINLSSLGRFEETLAELRAIGPIGPLPQHFEPRIAVPNGPIDKW